jgi:hypothetical protein
MTDLAGFFSVTYVSESVFTEAMASSWDVLWREASGALDYEVATPAGRLGASGALSVDMPSLTLLAATGGARLQLTARARLDLQIDGDSLGGVFLVWTSTVDVPFLVTQDEVYTKPILDLRNLSVTAADVVVTGLAGPAHPDATSLVLFATSRARIAEELRRRLAPYLRFALPTDRVTAVESAAMSAGGPGTVISTPHLKLGGIRVFDGWLAIAVDDTVTGTHGDVAVLTLADPMPDVSKQQVLVLADGVIVQHFLSANALFALRISLARYPGIRMSGDPVVVMGNDTVVATVRGKINAPDPFPGWFPFEAIITVNLWQTTPSNFVFNVSPNIHVDIPWQLDAVAAVADFLGADVFAQLRKANSGSQIFVPASIELPLPAPQGVAVRLAAIELKLRPDLITLRGKITTSARVSAPEIVSASFVTALPEGARHRAGPTSLSIRDRTIQLGFVEQGAPLLLADPTYLLRYAIYRGSTGHVAQQGWTWSGTPTFGETVDMWAPENYLETDYSAELIVERPPGTKVAESSNSIPVLDRFDRSRPYVRWHHEVMWWTLTDHWEPHNELRMSAVHKTAIRERCSFCDVVGQRLSRFEFQTFDELPPPEHAGMSGRLCRYCFPGA